MDSRDAYAKYNISAVVTGTNNIVFENQPIVFKCKFI